MIFLAESLVIERHRATVNYLFQSGQAYINLYTGEIPPTTEALPAGDLVCTSLTELGSAPSVTTDSTEIIFLDAVVQKDLTPTFARFFTAAGAAVMDVAVGDLSSSAPLKYNVAEFYEGGILKISSLVLREL